MALILYNPPGAVVTTNFNSSSSGTCYVGLQNQGATCYLNGVLQTLFMTPEFRQAIFSWRYDSTKDGPESSCIPFQLQKLFGFLQLSHQKYVDTRGITTSFGWTGNDLFQQQDVQELFRVLFDALEETFKGTPLSNVIDQIYAGEMIDYIRCLDVDHESERVDKFLDFSLAIIPFGKLVPLSSLTKCIEMFLRPEILDGENQYYASTVDRKVDAIKGFKFGKLPTIMTISLKRFVYDFSGENIVQKKINNVVRFPMVLDMNKYVSSKSKLAGRHKSDNENADFGSSVEFQPTDNDAHLPTSDVFEEFLQDQMAKLRRSRSEPVTESNHDQDMENSDDEIDLANPLPDLVDYFGQKSPDQILEEKGPLPPEILYESTSASDSDLQTLVEKRGEWIYELYAVLIHSGAITGGHYYAYIKDIDTKKWWNFNDSTVAEIGEKDVQDAWGREIKQQSYSPWYGERDLSNLKQLSGNNVTYSGANAYMLMYRKFNPNHLSTQARFPANEFIPDYISDLVKEAEASLLANKLAEEEKRLSLQVYIYWKGTPTALNCKTSDTFEQFFNYAWETLKLIDEPEFEDLRLTSAGSECHVACPLERIRLRFYAMSNSMCYDVYSCSSLEDRAKRLNSKILSAHNYYFELLRKDDVWDDYYASGVNLFLIIYDSINNAYLPQIQISLPNRSTLADLTDKAFKVFRSRYPAIASITLGDTKKDCRCYRSTSLNFSKPASVQELIDNKSALWDVYRMSFGEKVYVEFTDPLIGSEAAEEMKSPNPDEGDVPTVKHSPAYALLNTMLFNIKVWFNIPPETTFIHSLVVDSRMTVSELRSSIADALTAEREKGLLSSIDVAPIDKSRVRMCLSFQYGRELTGSNEIRSESVMDGCKIFLSYGFVPPPYHHVLNFKLYKPKHIAQQILLLNDDAIESLETIDVSSRDRTWSNTSCSSSVDNNQSASEPTTSTRLMAEGPWGSTSDCGSGFDDLAVEIPSAIPIDDELGSSGVDDSVVAEYSTAKSPFAVANAEIVSSQPSSGSNDLQVNGTDSIASDSNKNSNGGFTLEPSDFGVIMVSSEMSADDLEPLDEIDTICGNDETPVEVVREALFKKLQESQRIPTSTSKAHIRIRDSSDRSVGPVLQDGLSFRAQGCYLHASRVLLVQILSDEEAAAESHLHVAGEGNALVAVARWHRTTWSLGDRREALLPGSMVLRDVFRCLAVLFGIPPEDMLLLVLRSYARVPLSELHHEVPKPLTRGWQSFLNDANRLKDLNAFDSRLKHGDLILLQNRKEPLKVLTQEDLYSLQLVSDENQLGDAYESAYFGNNFSSMFKDCSTQSVSSSNSSSMLSTGIKIKTQKDWLKEQDMQSSSTSSIIHTSYSNSDSNSSSLHRLDADAIGSNHSHGRYGIGSGSGVDGRPRIVQFADAAGSDEFFDDREFQRAGGLALFSDLIDEN